MDLKKLSEPIDYKYRLQSAKNGRATIVSYIDSRQVQDRLDEIVGADNWQDDYKTIGNNLFCGIAINVGADDGIPNWVTKTDVGTESNVDKEKGEVSDAFKRAAVKWGIGRFLYSLGIITLKSKVHTNSKEYPCKDDGQTILWSVDDLTAYCRLVSASGELDRTKSGVTPIGKAVAPKTVVPVIPKATEPKPLQPSTEFNTLTDIKAVADERKEKAKKALADLNNTPAILKHIIADLKLKFTDIPSFVDATDIDEVLAVYTKFNVKK